MITNSGAVRALREQILNAIQETILGASGYYGHNQREIAARIGINEPRMSHLIRGKSRLFSLDALLDIACALGIEVNLLVQESQQLDAKGWAVRMRTGLRGRSPSPSALMFSVHR